ncbi:oxygen-independent coproporphyrinogen-3 oxidase [Faecalicatena contorta]|uniref:Oxygen-independent coproporphyrinogen-3 oxidase n=2 Tax=Faecalicatena contorta TaxID=39482 RepID=A0A316A165_9FIRM|nr:coproporphyrinogen dehydrogenase HemZ [Faecalicatena contorta]PWJ51676.1 oxygen-independent coproporphyrinogen-3 oxidase [Faecalicatena contorta]SUQ13232.1 oxygen-independent coproporphyrinogen-3 oxidase [Faecalicatena contorta]
MMIDISSKDTFYMYNAYHIAKAFFPNGEIRQKVDEGQEPLIRLELEGGSCFSIPADSILQYPDKREAKQYVTKLIYDYLSEMTGTSLSWGMLTGVRPTKLIMQKLETGVSEKDIVKFLRSVYSVSSEKAALGCEIARREQELLQKLDADQGYSLYIGIPFCPSICSYCSFGSSPLDKWPGGTELYLDALCKEITAIGQAARGRKLNTIYIGGGTPTTLSAQQLERLLRLLDSIFSYADLKEFTVEAGRPDSITREKLEVLAGHPVTRISVNPQTMQQKTLDAVGRRHRVEDVKTVFYLARELGFDNINMDLIAGLPGEDAEDMQDTLRQIEELGPDSLTVHVLAIKRAARYGQEGRKVELHSEITQMVEDSAKASKKMGLEPYYLYRQKNMAGNFENVGYAKVDKAGIYNILIMEEKQTILAAGAGASTKIVLPEKIGLENGRQSNLVRIENVKDIRSYIERIDEMIERKGEWLWR